jgi:hypothetical protein
MAVFDSQDEHDDTNEAHERRIVRCRSCRARIIFLTTAAGSKMPCDADSVEAHDQVYDAKRHESHFATCPTASAHRRKS